MRTLAYFVRVGIVKRFIFYIVWLKESAIKVFASADTCGQCCKTF
jgi:hypothetical protein